MRIAITGISGFIGTHLKNYLSTIEGVVIVSIDRNVYENFTILKQKVAEVDVIIHLAAINRHEDNDVLQITNIKLVELLIQALIETQSRPYIIFSSSLQESYDNPYGRSKKQGQDLLKAWSEKFNGSYASLVIPNVFGPFGKPYYNSVVATFCHQIALGEEPTVIEDKEIQLIYINELVSIMGNLIKYPKYGKVGIQHQFQVKVSELLTKLSSLKTSYLDHCELPDLSAPLELALFNTFRCYVPAKMYPMKYMKHEDARGMFVEIMRNNSGGQFSFSTTNPGVTRGNHFHTRKFERFAVIKGEAKIKVRRIDKDEVDEYYLSESTPAFVDMPVWHTHCITNTGDNELITLFWINEPYDAVDPDTFYLDV